MQICTRKSLHLDCLTLATPTVCQEQQSAAHSFFPPHLSFISATSFPTSFSSSTHILRHQNRRRKLCKPLRPLLHTPVIPTITTTTTTNTTATSDPSPPTNYSSNNDNTTPSSTSPSSGFSSRELDARGFVLPVAGDVVLYAGKWPGEDEAGIVEAVRFVASRSAHVVDVQPLRRVTSELFAVSSLTRRGRNVWLDVSEVRIIPNAEYVISQDAYRVRGARDGYANIPTPDLKQKERAQIEYLELQKSIFLETLITAATCTTLPALFNRFDIAIPYATGAVTSLLYLFLLVRAVDAVGAISTAPAGMDNYNRLSSGIGGILNTIGSRLLVLRFMLPVLPFVVVAYVKTDGVALSSFEKILGSLTRTDALAIVIGLLTYKVPFLKRTLSEFVSGMADMDVNGTGGAVSTLATLAAKRLRSSSSGNTTTTATTAKTKKPVLVFAGPSGAGKSTLMRRLLEERGEEFTYCVSHTTRSPRDGEVDGKDYNFVSEEEFNEMIRRGEFVEHVRVHGHGYGTSVASVNKAIKSNKVCLLDLDIQGVETVRRRQENESDWETRFVWVAPPSLTALEERLRRRESETDTSIRTRLDNAMRELSYAATNDVFDLIVINDDVDRAYLELSQFIDRMQLL